MFRAYIPSLIFAVIFICQLAWSSPNDVTFAKSPLVQAGLELQQVTHLLAQATPRTRAALLKRAEVAISTVQTELKRLFHGKVPDVSDAEREGLRLGLLHLQSGPTPLLIFVRDAIRISPKVHHQLAASYATNGRPQKATHHNRMAALSTRPPPTVQPIHSK